MNEPRRVVIVGGGFGGLHCARGLRRLPVAVTLVDRRNHHLFQPLLYQVATASLSPADIATPIRSILRRQGNVRVWLGEVTGIDLDRREALLVDGAALPYDVLVLATGATHSYFGHPEWEESAPGLKTIEDATHIRRRFLLAFEQAERAVDAAARRRLLTFAIVGGGPTGVELAGAMADMARRILPRDFRAVDTRSARIVLLEGLPRVLPGFDPVLSERARRELEQAGVEVRTATRVTAVEPDGVRIGAEKLETANVFWAAGVQASPLGRALGAPLDGSGRVRVREDCSLPGRPEVLVIGDLARFEWRGAPLPGLAPFAIQMGRHAARCIAADLAGRPRPPWRPVDKGSLATLGHSAAVGKIGRLRVVGLPAWLLWVFVHILYLIGFRNRLMVLLEWGWAWLTWQRGMRLITGPARPSEENA